jgi:hypothetical protein
MLHLGIGLTTKWGNKRSSLAMMKKDFIPTGLIIIIIICFICVSKFWLNFNKRK